MSKPDAAVAFLEMFNLPQAERGVDALRSEIRQLRESPGFRHGSPIEQQRWLGPLEKKLAELSAETEANARGLVDVAAKAWITPLGVHRLKAAEDIEHTVSVREWARGKSEREQLHIVDLLLKKNDVSGAAGVCEVAASAAVTERALAIGTREATASLVTLLRAKRACAQIIAAIHLSTDPTKVTLAANEARSLTFEDGTTRQYSDAELRAMGVMDARDNA